MQKWRSMVRKNTKKVNVKNNLHIRKPRRTAKKIIKKESQDILATQMDGLMQEHFILMNPTTWSIYEISPATFEQVGGMEMLGKLQSLENHGNLVELGSGNAFLEQKAYSRRLEKALEEQLMELLSLLKQEFNTTKNKEKPMAKKFIQEAIKHPGALHKELKVPAGKKIPVKKLKAAEKKGGLVAKRAHLAETLRKLPKRGAK